MRPECAYSFDDLYNAAHGNAWSADERAAFMSASQEYRNAKVSEWAARAQWGTDERFGSDGVAYMAFCPLWSSKS